MEHHVFTVHDAKAEAFLPPFCLHQIGMAVRAFADAVNGADHQFAKHPEDYVLFRIGTFDDAKGVIDTLPGPVVVASGVEVLLSGGSRDEPLEGKGNGTIAAERYDSPVFEDSAGTDSS